MSSMEIMPGSPEYNKRISPFRKQQTEKKEMGFLDRIQEGAIVILRAKYPALTSEREQDIRIVFSEIISSKKGSWERILANAEPESIEKTEHSLSNGLAMEAVKKLKEEAH